MGSSTGVARGQLRPQFAGRNPPFIVAGLFIALALLGVSYYSLSTQYTTLQTQLENLVKSEERSRITCQERSRENEKLQKLTEQLRDKLTAQTNDLRIKQSDLQTLKESQQMAESNLAAEKNRLESENRGLIEKTGQLQKSLDDINSENVKLKHQLESMDKQAKDKLATIDQLNNKVNELSAKLSSGKQDDKDAVEVKTDLMPSEPGLGDIDSPNGPGEAPNKTADGINGSSEAVKMKDGPSSIISNPDNQKASLPKPNPLGKAEETVNEAAMANLV